MQRFHYSTTGASLSSQAGQIIRLPVTGDLNADFGRVLICVALHNLTSDHYIARDHGWRLYVRSGGGVELQCNSGADGTANSTQYLASYAQLQNAGIVLQVGQIHYFYIDAINIGRTAETDVRLYIDAKAVTFTKNEASYFNEFTQRPRALGGHNTQSFADFTAFEYIKTRRSYNTTVEGVPATIQVPGWSLQEQRFICNAGRGIDLTQFAPLYANVVEHLRFQARRYNAAGEFYTPLKGTTPPQYFSSAYRTEYAETSSLTLDGIDDMLRCTDKALATPGNFSYDMEVMPFFSGIPADLGTANTLLFNQSQLRTLIDGTQYFSGTDAAAVWVSVLTDGVMVGVVGKQGQFGTFFQCLILYSAPISATQFTRLGVRFTNLVPELVINGVVVATGSASPHPVYAGLELARRYSNQPDGKPFGGKLRNFQVWRTSRTTEQFGQPFFHTPQAGLEASYNFSRPGTNSTLIQDYSGNARHQEMENFVLAPVIQTFRRRAGRQLY